MKYLIVILSILLMSCGATWHLQQAKKHELIAIAKGAKISRDTVYKDVEKRVEIPGDTVFVKVKPAIDVPSFDLTMFGNDSLVLLIDSLHKDISKGTAINPEKTMYALKQANDQIRVLKDRLQKGFSKDSTYNYQADSITRIWVTVKEGLVSAVGYQRDRTELTWKDRLPILIDQKVKSGFTVLEMIGGVLAGAAVMFMVVLLVRAVKRDPE